MTGVKKFDKKIKTVLLVLCKSKGKDYGCNQEEIRIVLIILLPLPEDRIAMALLS